MVNFLYNKHNNVNFSGDLYGIFCDEDVIQVKKLGNGNRAAVSEVLCGTPLKNYKNRK